MIMGSMYVNVNALELPESQEEVFEDMRGLYGYRADLYITSGTAKPSTRVVNGDSAIIGIVCIMTLQKYQNGSWVSVETWRKTSSGESLYVSGSKSVNHGRYRVKSRITVYKGDSTETLETYSGMVTY